MRTVQNVTIGVDQTGINVCESQSRYVGYYEIMKNTFDRQLPPPKKLGIKSIRIHSIAGNSQKTGRFSKPLLCFNAPMSFSAVTSGVGKGDGSDLKVKIISKKELIFQCVCAKQENCTVSLYHTHTHHFLIC